MNKIFKCTAYLFLQFLLLFITGVSYGQNNKEEETFVDYQAFSANIINTLKASWKTVDFGSTSALKSNASKITADSKAGYSPISQATKIISAEKLAEQRTGGVLIICKYYKAFQGKREMVDVIATGTVLSGDGLCITNYHVLMGQIDPAIPLHPADSLTFAVNRKGELFPIERIEAYNKIGDQAIFRIKPGKHLLQPIPLGNTLRVGAKVYAITHPDANLYYFSQGYVARNTAEKQFGPMANRMEITADYAKGSSGGPILDEDGNLAGMVSSTRPIYYANNEGQQMVIKRTIPVSSIKALLKTATK